jgi:putative inorganic carbon (HCO3(-)) transporter
MIFPLNPISQRIGSIFNTHEGSNQGRLEIWGEAFNVFKDKPLLGVGLGAYSYEIKPIASYRDPIYAHNLYLEFLAEIGIPGLIFWLGIIVSAIWIFTKNYLRNKKSEIGIISFALGSSLVWFSVHSFLEMPVYSPIILPLLVLTLAFASYLEDRAINKALQ